MQEDVKTSVELGIEIDSWRDTGARIFHSM